MHPSNWKLHSITSMNQKSHEKEIREKDVHVTVNDTQTNDRQTLTFHTKHLATNLHFLTQTLRI